MNVNALAVLTTRHGRKTPSGSSGVHSVISMQDQIILNLRGSERLWVKMCYARGENTYYQL